MDTEVKSLRESIVSDRERLAVVSTMIGLPEKRTRDLLRSRAPCQSRLRGWRRSRRCQRLRLLPARRRWWISRSGESWYGQA